LVDKRSHRLKNGKDSSEGESPPSPGSLLEPVDENLSLDDDKSLTSCQEKREAKAGLISVVSEAVVASPRMNSTIPFYQERLHQLLQDAKNCEKLHKEESDFMTRLRSKALSQQQAGFDKANATTPTKGKIEF
jgi:hypothetical protein